MHAVFSIFISCFLLFLPSIAFAQIAITEVLWAGSDLSTTDEWFELLNFRDHDVDLSLWSVTYLTSKGDDGLIVRFATGTVLAAGEYMVVARNSASASRLLLEPDVVTPSMALLNTKLLLRLRDPHGNILDTVDDGFGTPFAGANPSGGVKASMERLDPTLPGTDPSNWATADVSLGLDPEALLFGTPGYPREPKEPPPCNDPLMVQIFVQDGELSGVGRTTVNFQAIATAGSIEKAVCHWNFSDGFRSDSCNPPPHAFEQIGVTIVRLEAKNQCGITLVQELHVTLTADPTSHSSSVSTSRFDGSKIYLSSALPNPLGSDADTEWVELRNSEDRLVSLEGWKLVVGTKSLRQYALRGSIGPNQRLKYYDKELNLTLPNSESKIVLESPVGQDVSSISWKKAEEKQIYYPDDLREVATQGIAEHVIDGDTFVLALQGEAREVFGEDRVHVRLLGIDAPEVGLGMTSSSGSYTSLEFLRALIEKKKVELEFDTYIWDSYGRLLAYVYDDRGILTQEQLLGMGYAEVTESFEFYRKESLLFKQDEAKKRRIGIWNMSNLNVGSSQYEAGVHEERIPEDILSTSASCIPGTIRVSEVYSNPHRALKEEQKVVCSKNDCSLLTSEWIELERADLSCSLLGWSLSLQSGKKRFDLSSFTSSGHFLLLSDNKHSFDLRNAVGTASLWAPGSIAPSVFEFPSLKVGKSAVFEGDKVSCLSDTITPSEQNICTTITNKNRAKKIASTRKNTARTVAFKYAPIFQQELENSSELTETLFDSEKPKDSSLGFLIFFGIVGGFLSHGCLFLFRAGLKRFLLPPPDQE